MAIADVVTATLIYATYANDSKPFYIFSADPTQMQTNIVPAPKELAIENVRGKEDQYDLDNAGFKFIKHTSSVKNFNDEEVIKQAYYSESVEVLKKYTGASRVVVFDHVIRRHHHGAKDQPGNRQPARLVHADQTPEAARNHVRQHAPDIAQELPKHRYQIVNLWRPISHPALDSPLALCDYRSVNWEQDLVPSTVEEGETFTVKFNPAHQWKYLRGMTLDEAVLIKCAESRVADGVALLSPHTSFKDPSTPKDAPLRESIELRALVFYDD